MIEIAALVEGQTELDFVSRVLAPHLGLMGVSIWGTLPGRVHKRGGVPAWEAVRGDILRYLKHRVGRICTTMFDFYGMPLDWPGRSEAGKAPMEHRGTIVQQALSQDVASAAGPQFRGELFIPYVQVHEFEALLFADVARTAARVAMACGIGTDALKAQLQAILHDAGNPEQINDGQETAPSKRLIHLAPAYHKRLHGVQAALDIGLATMRQQCANFDRWLTQLESVARREGSHE